MNCRSHKDITNPPASRVVQPVEQRVVDAPDRRFLAPPAHVLVVLGTGEQAAPPALHAHASPVQPPVLILVPLPSSTTSSSPAAAAGEREPPGGARRPETAVEVHWRLEVGGRPAARLRAVVGAEQEPRLGVKAVARRGGAVRAVTVRCLRLSFREKGNPSSFLS